ncbi:MAG: hypothetical protein P8L37_06985 [Phycisphaerales bacterium]|nr:hypothetical protein [Phycisphaerales bacterium]
MTPMPRYSNARLLLYSCLLCVPFVQLMITMFGQSPNQRIGFYWLLSLLLFAIALMWGISSIGRYNAKRFMDHEYRNTRWGPLLCALRRARLPVTRQRAKKAQAAMARLRDEAAADGISIPRTIIDHRFAISVANILLEPNMLEPEPIIPGTARIRRRRIMGVIFGLLFLLFGLMLDWQYCTIIGIAALVVPILSLNIIRRHAETLRGGLHRFVAGQGFVRSTRGHIWNSSDSLCVIRSMDRRTRIDDACIVVLYGPNGVRLIPFPSTLDPHFISFWRRWNHPDPRPTLAATAQSSGQAD